MKAIDDLHIGLWGHPTGDPEYIGPTGDELIVWCDDCNKYHRQSVQLWSDGYRFDDDDLDTSAMQDLPDDKEDRVGYLEDVERTGDDHLGLLYVKPNESNHWRLVFHRSLLGMVLVYGRRDNHKRQSAIELPAEVLEFANAQPYKGTGRFVLTDVTPEEVVTQSGKDIHTDTYVARRDKHEGLIVDALIATAKSPVTMVRDTKQAARKAMR